MASCGMMFSRRAFLGALAAVPVAVGIALQAKTSTNFPWKIYFRPGWMGADKRALMGWKAHYSLGLDPYRGTAKTSTNFPTAALWRKHGRL